MFLVTLVARGADAADATGTASPISASTLQSPVAVSTDVTAQNPTVTPEAYLAQQVNAPEDIIVHVVLMKSMAAQTEDKRPGALLVEARAMVTGVTHSKTGLKIGSAIYLQYPYIPVTPGIPGAPPPELVKVNGDYRAYLSGGPGDAPYIPVAGGQSFLNPAQDPGAKPGDVATNAMVNPTFKQTGPIAEPSMLPTPDNPSPKGVVKVRDADVAVFAKVVDMGGGKWGVSVAGSNPLPMQTIGGAKPLLLVYYGPLMRRAPPTQPIVITYQAGTEPAPPPDQGNVTVERALVLDSDKHLLGDLPWALRTSGNMRPIPLPVWQWNTFKLEVQDPTTETTKTIMLNGMPTPEPVMSPDAPSPRTPTSGDQSVSPAPVK